MEKISIEQATKEGLKHYFTGKPCKRGHISKRYLINKECVNCRAEKTQSYKESGYFKNYRIENKEKEQQYRKKYKTENKNKTNANTAKRRSLKAQRTPKWCDENKVKYFYTLAQYFEFITLGIKYHVDHIIPLNGDTVCGLHVDNNLQILRADQNLTKNNKWCWDTQS